MQIVAKSKFNRQIYDKLAKGADAIELHLDKDFLKAQVFWDEQIVRGVPIAAVHAPLFGSEGDTNIEFPRNRDVLVKTCDFARKIADAQGHSVIVVCHLTTDPNHLRKLGTYDSLVFFFRDLANTYPQLEFAVENVSMFDQSTSFATGHIGLRAINADSAVSFVKDIDHDRVGTCLDTCHALMTIRLLSTMAIYLYLDKEQCEDVIRFGMEAFFKTYKDTIKCLHLANAKTHGLGYDHGLPFTDSEDDIEILQNILWLYHQYEYRCPITIEVKESDYYNAVNFVETYKNVQKQLETHWPQNNINKKDGKQ